MAQAIHCDIHNQAHLADVLVTQLASGDTMAACTEGYLELCRAYVQAADQAAQDAQADQDAMTRLLEVSANVPADQAPEADPGSEAPSPSGTAQDGPQEAEGGQATTGQDADDQRQAGVVSGEGATDPVTV